MGRMKATLFGGKPPAPAVPEVAARPPRVPGALPPLDVLVTVWLDIREPPNGRRQRSWPPTNYGVPRAIVRAGEFPGLPWTTNGVFSPRARDSKYDRVILERAQQPGRFIVIAWGPFWKWRRL